MVLNSPRLMPWLSRSYCGMVLYFANSARQSASPSGGMTPVTGFHSTIESPDSVSRVAPPTSTMAKTSPAMHHSHTPTARAVGVDLRVPAPTPDNASCVLEACHRTVMEPITLAQGQPNIIPPRGIFVPSRLRLGQGIRWQGIRLRGLPPTTIVFAIRSV